MKDQFKCTCGGVGYGSHVVGCDTLKLNQPHNWNYDPTGDRFICTHCSAVTLDHSSYIGECKRLKSDLTIDDVQSILEMRVKKALPMLNEAIGEIFTSLFPEAVTGDIDPMASFKLDEALEDALNSWTWYNIGVSDDVKEIRI
jgi:hypothetical protein